MTSTNSRLGEGNFSDNILAVMMMTGTILLPPLASLFAIPYALYGIVKMAINCLKPQKNNKKAETTTTQNKNSSDDKKEIKIEDNKKPIEYRFAPGFFDPNSDA